ncbi:MAG: hypothetical protein ABIX37_07285 [Gammaproteobacteria bacterium]
MLQEFLTTRREQLIERCRAKAATRFTPSLPPAPLDTGVPLFLQQLIDTLALPRPEAPSIGDDEAGPFPVDIGRSAALHGADLLRRGYTVDQVVHDYGDVCQTVTELALEVKASIGADDFRILNGCLDDAIAGAVMAYSQGGQIALDDQKEELQQQLSMFSDEQRRLVDIAVHAFTAIKTGGVGLTGATAALLMHALMELRSLGARSLPETGAEPKTPVAIQR